MLLCYYVIRVLHYCNITTELIHIHTDYQYITTIIKQRIQLYYNNLHTIIWYRLICNICKSGCHSSIQHKTFNIEYLNYRPITKYQALHSHDIQLCIQVCHKQTDIYIFHQVNTTLFYSYNGHGATIHFKWISVQTNRASCVFVRQKVFCQTKPTCPPSRSGDFPPKSENLKRGKYPGINIKSL